MQRLMDSVLAGMEGVCAYLDDVLIGTGGATVEVAVKAHHVLLKIVFQRLAAAHFHLKGTKCELFRTQIELCGHELVGDEQQSTWMPFVNGRCHEH